MYFGYPYLTYGQPQDNYYVNPQYCILPTVYKEDMIFKQGREDVRTNNREELKSKEEKRESIPGEMGGPINLPVEKERERNAVETRNLNKPPLLHAQGNLDSSLWGPTEDVPYPIINPNYLQNLHYGGGIPYLTCPYQYNPQFLPQGIGTDAMDILNTKEMKTHEESAKDSRALNAEEIIIDHSNNVRDNSKEQISELTPNPICDITNRRETKRGQWTVKEEANFLEIANKFPKNWAKISKELGDRSRTQLKDKYRQLKKRNFKLSTSKFTVEEDNVIRKFIKHYGFNWKKLALHFDERSAAQLQNRYYTKLRFKGTEIDKNKNLEVMLLHESSIPPYEDSAFSSIPSPPLNPLNPSDSIQEPKQVKVKVDAPLHTYKRLSPEFKEQILLLRQQEVQLLYYSSLIKQKILKLEEEDKELNLTIKVEE